MSIGPHIKPWMKAQAVVLREQHRHAKEIRNEIRRLLELQDPETATVYKNFPSVSAIEKLLASLSHGEPLPQDRDWHMSSLDQFPIESQAIGAVLDVWRHRTELGQPFTIREAKWAARLSAVENAVHPKPLSARLFALIHPTKEAQAAAALRPEITSTESLAAHSWEYARLERVHEIIGRPFDSTVLDKFLMRLEMSTNASALARGDDEMVMVIQTLQTDGFKEALNLWERKRVKGGGNREGKH
jgi:hypothetical protein